MIEKYFVKGLTYNWNPPPKISTAPKNGAIVHSGINHPPPLRYIGLHGEVMYGETSAPSTYGLTMNFVIPHRWLHYVEGQTAYVRSVNTDVLTGFMSGCWICSWSEGGQRRVGHIGTVSSAGKNQPPNSTVKTAFLNSPAMQQGSHIRGYSPADAWDVGESMKITRESKSVTRALIMSLVTTSNDFYSILMLETKTPGEWVCGGKKKVHGHHRATILQALQ